MKRRILFVVDSLFPLGAMLQLCPLLSSLADENFEVHLAAPGSQDNTELATGLCDANLHLLPPSNRLINQVVALRQLICQIQPDIVHGWGSRTHLKTLVAATRFKNLSKVLTFFGKPEPKGMAQIWIEKLLREKTTRLVGTHETTKLSLRESGFNEEIQIIPNSNTNANIDRRSAKQRLLTKIGIETAEPVFIAGTVSRLAPAYRVKDLVWAADLLCCIRRDFHLVIFGTGDDTAVRRFISKSVSENNIHLIPLDQAKQTDLAALDFYWNPQLQIPMPTPMLMAMALGIPTVSVIGPETAGAIIPLRSALAANFGARDEFARWTKYLIEQTESARQISAQGKQHVENLFSTDEMVRGYLELYAAT